MIGPMALMVGGYSVAYWSANILHWAHVRTDTAPPVPLSMCFGLPTSTPSEAWLPLFHIGSGVIDDVATDPRVLMGGGQSAPSATGVVADEADADILGIGPAMSRAFIVLVQAILAAFPGLAALGGAASAAGGAVAEGAAAAANPAIDYINEAAGGTPRASSPAASPKPGDSGFIGPVATNTKPRTVLGPYAVPTGAALTRASHGG